MASTVPIAGSAYTYAYATMGEFIAWVTDPRICFRRDNCRDRLVQASCAILAL
jgi:hypothetical protein